MNQNCQSSSGQTRSLGNEPAIPLPNPGEGIPAYPGDDNAAGVPVIPLPNPGEGGPVYPGDDNSAAGVPVIPLPNPGEGGPVYPGNGSGGNNSGNNTGSSGSWGCSGGSCTSILPGIISSIVRPNTARSRVRFLNAAYGYSSFRISVDNSRVVNLLNYASATGYSQVSAGYRTVTVSGRDGYIYIQKTMPFQANAVTTIAIINTASGMDLLQITDTCCPPSNGYSSFRMGNLAYNSGPLDVLLSDGRVVFTDMRFKEVTSFKRIRPGTYQFFYADTNLQPMADYLDIETLDSAWLGVYPPQETFGSLYLNVQSNAIYTVYLLQSGTGRNNIQNLVLTDR